MKSCKIYGLSNSLNGCKDEVLVEGRKVQMIQKRMCLIAVMQILRDCMTSTNVVLYCHTVGYIFLNLSFKRKENGGWGAGNIKQSLYRPGKTLRVPGGTGSQISKQSANQGGKVVSPVHRPPYPPGYIPGTHFC